jgi:hypothetical protein
MEVAKNMNGVSPFNYQKLTPRQDKEGRDICEVGMAAVCLFVSLAYALYIPFKPHATDFDALAGGACLLVAVLAVRELWRMKNRA